MNGTPSERRRKARRFSGLSALLGEDNSREQEALRGRLLRAVEEELTPRQRQMMILYYREGLTIPQIGAKLGVARSTVSRTLRRGEARLRRCLRYTAPALLDAAPAVRRNNRAQRAKRRR